MTIQIADFRPDIRNTRRGFFGVTVPDVGITVRDFVLHLSNGKWWVAYPSREYQDKTTGERKWWPYVAFADSDAKNRFQEEVVAALRVFTPDTFAETGGPGSSQAASPKPAYQAPAKPGQRAMAASVRAQAPIPGLPPNARKPSLPDDDLPF